jgi:hypothetical protein
MHCSCTVSSLLYLRYPTAKTKAVGFESGEPGVSEAKLITLFCSLAKFTASEMLYIEGWVLSKPHGNLPAFIEPVLQLFLDWFTFST